MLDGWSMTAEGSGEALRPGGTKRLVGGFVRGVVEERHEVGELVRLLGGLEPLIAGAHRSLVESLALVERADVLGDLVAFVEEPSVGLDEPDQLLAADLALRRVFPRILGDQLHDVVVVDNRGGEEDELEVELIDHGIDRLNPRSGSSLLLF